MSAIFRRLHERSKDVRAAHAQSADALTASVADAQWHEDQARLAAAAAALKPPSLARSVRERQKLLRAQRAEENRLYVMQFENARRQEAQAALQAAVSAETETESESETETETVPPETKPNRPPLTAAALNSRVNAPNAHASQSNKARR